jgi:MYXO-CTERM domain-containing protein
MCQLVNGSMHPNRVVAEIDQVHDMIKGYVAEEAGPVWGGKNPLDETKPWYYGWEYRRMRTWYPARVASVRQQLQSRGFTCPAGCQVGQSEPCKNLTCPGKRSCQNGLWSLCVPDPGCVPGAAPVGAPAAVGDAGVAPPRGDGAAGGGGAGGSMGAAGGAGGARADGAAPSGGGGGAAGGARADGGAAGAAGSGPSGSGGSRPSSRPGDPPAGDAPPADGASGSPEAGCACDAGGAGGRPGGGALALLAAAALGTIRRRRR